MTVTDLAERIREFVDAIEPPVTLAEIEALMERDRTESRVPPAPAYRRRRWPVLVGVAAACALAVTLVLQLLPAESPQTDAAAALNHVAAVASLRAASPTPAAGQYLFYEVTQGMMVTSPEPVGVRPTSDIVTERTQTWVAADGHGRQRAVVLKTSPLQPSAGTAFGSGTTAPFAPVGYDMTYPSSKADGGPLVPGSGGQWYLSFPDSSNFPTQPLALKAYIVRTLKVTGGPTTIFLLAGDTLQVGARPALRAALFRLIQTLPGIKDLGPTKDEAGQRGIGVAIDGFGNEYTLVFNPKTSAVLGETVRSLKTKNLGGEVISRGTLVGFKNYGRTGITGSITTVPNSTVSSD
jgi:hypothetical protein